MKTTEKKPKNGAERLRDRFFEIKKNIKISPELEKATSEKKPADKTEKELDYDDRKIASPKQSGDLDL